MNGEDTKRLFRELGAMGEGINRIDKRLEKGDQTLDMMESIVQQHSYDISAIKKRCRKRGQTIETLAAELQAQEVTGVEQLIKAKTTWSVLKIIGAVIVALGGLAVALWQAVK